MNYYKCGAPDNSKVDWVSEGVLGAKNLIPYPYSETTRTAGGITFTDNGDGSITISGTSASSGNIWFNGSDTNGFLLEANVEYKFSSDVIDDDKLYIQLQRVSTGSFNSVVATVEGTTAMTTTDGYYRVQLGVKPYASFDSPIVIKPMLTPASVTDLSFTPYAMTNRQLTEKKVDWGSEGVLGAKNLLLYPYFHTTRTTSGITFTDNGDGTITVDGTASGYATFHLANNNAGNLLKEGSYILSGCPTQTGDAYYIRIQDMNSVNLAMNTGGDTEFTLASDTYARIYIQVRTGTAITTPILFKPMIRPAIVKDDTYAEYALTNKMITNRIDCTQTTAGTYVLKATVDANGVATYSWVSE